MTPDARLARLTTRVRGQFPRSVRVAATLPCSPETLLPPERSSIARAVPTRQREFAGGRAAARAAMHQLTGLTLPLPMGPDRAPIWPAGLTGSITHTAGLCLAVVTDDPAIRGLGIDLEEDAPLPPEILAEVILPDEHGQNPRAVFSAKETVFKALYPMAGAVFGFEAVRIIISDQIFIAETRMQLGPVPCGTRLSGHLSWGDGLILTALSV